MYMGIYDFWIKCNICDDIYHVCKNILNFIL